MVADKMVAIFGIDYNSSEFNSYLVTQKLQISYNTHSGNLNGFK